MDARSVELSISPWVAGTHVIKYYGPISVERFLAGFVASELEEAADAILVDLQEKAAGLEANYVVGVEITADPFAIRDGEKGVRLHAVGTAAELGRWGV